MPNALISNYKTSSKTIWDTCWKYVLPIAMIRESTTGLEFLLINPLLFIDARINYLKIQIIKKSKKK